MTVIANALAGNTQAIATTKTMTITTSGETGDVVSDGESPTTPTIQSTLATDVTSTGARTTPISRRTNRGGVRTMPAGQGTGDTLTKATSTADGKH